jgi:hypothetical protein
MPVVLCLAIMSMCVGFGEGPFMWSRRMLGDPAALKAMPGPCRPQSLEREHEQQDQQNRMFHEGVPLWIDDLIDQTGIGVGNRISNRVRPAADSTCTVPLCAAMIDLVIANPRPAPSVDRFRDESIL